MKKLRMSGSQSSSDHSTRLQHQAISTPDKAPLLFDKLVWTTADVARELNLSQRYVYKLISMNKIPYCKVGRLVRFSPVRVIEWLDKGGTR